MQSDEHGSLHPIAERILDGESVTMCEISQYNAQCIMDWARRGMHDVDSCYRKHCVHGARDVDIDYAAELASHAYCCRG